MLSLTIKESVKKMFHRNGFRRIPRGTILYHGYCGCYCYKVLNELPFGFDMLNANDVMAINGNKKPENGTQPKCPKCGLISLSSLRIKND